MLFWFLLPRRSEILDSVWNDWLLVLTFVDYWLPMLYTLEILAIKLLIVGVLTIVSPGMMDREYLEYIINQSCSCSLWSLFSSCCSLFPKSFITFRVRERD